MDKKFAFLEYTFMFSPSEAWTSLTEFEKSLADFFGAHGLEAQVVKTVEGQVGKRILLIQKAEDLIEEPTDKKPTPKVEMKETLDKLRNKKY